MDDPRTLLRRYDLSPRKSLGQNFLVDPSAPERIADLADLGPEDTVLEVGAGLGTMTAPLAQRAGRVIAVETDPELVAVLQQELGDAGNVEIVHEDILALDPATLFEGGDEAALPLWGMRRPHYHVVANLPYYITAAVMRHILEARVRPARMVVTVQKEVAYRMTASPGDMSLLAVSVQFYGAARIGFRLKRGAFYPVPKVESAVVRLDIYDEPPVPVTDVARFFSVVRAGFAQRRKQLRNTLSATLRLEPADVASAMEAAGVDPTRRAETLSIEEWGTVENALAPLMES